MVNSNVIHTFQYFRNVKWFALERVKYLSHQKFWQSVNLIIINLIMLEKTPKSQIDKTNKYIYICVYSGDIRTGPSA